MEIGLNKWRFYEWVASATELLRELGGRPTSLLGSGFLGVWPFWAEIISFLLLVWDSGEYGPWNALWGERLFGRLLFWTYTLAGDMTFVVTTPFNRKVI